MYLREYLYADVDKIRSLAAQLMKGVPEEARSTEKKMKQLTLGMKAVAGSVNDWTSEEYTNRSLADSLFGDLEDILESEGWLFDISDILQGASTDYSTLPKSYSPGTLVRITAPGLLFDARFVARVLGGLAAASDGIATLNPVEDQSNTRSAAGRKNQQKKHNVNEPVPDTLESEIHDYDSRILGIEASTLRAIVKISRGLFSPGVHLMLTPRGDEITITARLQEGGKYLETNPEILFSRYGTARQSWTLVGSIGAYSQSASSDEVGKQEFMDNDTINRSKFANFVNYFMQFAGHQGLADMPQYPGFSIVPLAAYRTIIKLDHLELQTTDGAAI
ncbi:hypothetical protein AB0J71_36300 [Nonomuraea sp. NPDC049637]|uniref:DUF6414 family protein n=1 Tax=Nonomuraea sp. NPDC049637 TaxID=3154356 RepID=UPI003418EB19